MARPRSTSRVAMRSAAGACWLMASIREGRARVNATQGSRRAGREAGSCQRRALLVCGVLGPFAVDLVGAILATLNSPRWPVREAALHALVRIGASKAVCHAAAAAALDRSAAVRAAALELLALRPGEVPEVVTSALRHHHPRVRCRALRAIARLDPEGSVGPLTEALTHSHYRVRRTAAAQ